MRMLPAAIGAVLLAVPLVLPLAARADETSLFAARPGPVYGAGHPASADDPDSGVEMIGRPAPEWSFDRWVRGAPASLTDLKGKVVLVRWWTEGCHYCETTLPALETLRKEHGAQDLVVLGVFHPKPPHAVSDRHILEVARRLGFSGPIALDRDWTTLNRYWLDANPERNWTSVSFLIDRRGLVRWVHGGGEYHPSNDPMHARCRLEYEELENVLTTVLAEPAPTTH